jgi:ribose/xylose/arabinose/galactoside ABC-type transport system permease subunit
MDLTHFLARLLGLFCIVISVMMLSRRQVMLAIVRRCIQNQALLFLVEILGLAAGLAIVLGHNIWSNGLLPFIVTLIGWLTLIRSIILLFLSPEAIERFIKAVRYEQNYYLFTAIPLLIGLYLTAAGLGSG